MGGRLVSALAGVLQTSQCLFDAMKVLSNIKGAFYAVRKAFRDAGVSISISVLGNSPKIEQAVFKRAEYMLRLEDKRGELSTPQKSDDW